MAVMVNSSRVRVGKKTYLPGETIEGLAKKDEKRLIDLGVCSPAPSTSPTGDSGPNTSHPGM